MKNIINRMINSETLSRQEAKEVLIRISEGGINTSLTSSFLTVFMMRPITVEELSGFREALLELCIPINLGDFDPIDLCGTGGDGKNTFNISTLSAFVAAGAGIKVAKHGNYGVSSVCGSSTVLEYLGINFTNKESDLQRNIDEAGICFLHAPLFHPALKNVGPIRKELGMKTFFNMLGPMVNPSRPQKQLVGVYSLELLRLYSYLFQESGTQFVILHSLDGYDEISLTGEIKAVSNETDRVLTPHSFNLPQLKESDIFGGDTVKEAATIFHNILSGKGTAEQKSVVYANAAMAIYCYYPEIELDDALHLAKESLDSGRAFSCFETLKNLN